MGVIRHHLIRLVILLSVTGLTDTSVAQNQNYWQKAAKSSSLDNTVQVCIDDHYRITYCQTMTMPVNDRPLWVPATSSDPSSSPQNIYFALGKRNCGRKGQQYRGLLHSLFPAIPDLQLEINSFTVNVDVPSEIQDINQSTIHLGYRNCW